MWVKAKLQHLFANFTSRDLTTGGHFLTLYSYNQYSLSVEHHTETDQNLSFFTKVSPERITEIWLSSK